jgi:ABC-type transport system involved in multi-copper enzyme maturation permease subunit
VILQLLGLVAWTVGILLIVSWVVRRQDHKPGKAIFETRKHDINRSTVQDKGISWLETITRKISGPRANPETKPVETEPEYLLETAGPASKRDSIRIIWAIASKDIRLTLKSKLAISIMIGTAFILASNSALPLLVRSLNKPSAIVYDPGHSTLMREMAASDDLRLVIMHSLEEFQKTLTASPESLVGLVVPEDFDWQVENMQALELEANVVHWADSDKVLEQVAFFEDQLERSTLRQVRIQLAEQPLYPSTKPDGQLGLSLLTFPLILFIMGVALVPLLFVEERLAHTLDVLLISPARISEVVLGKALAGVFYCMLAAVVLFLFNSYLIVHWGVAILTAGLCAALAVGIGLLVGIISDSPTTSGLWGSLTLIAIIALVVVGYLPGTNWPPMVSHFLQYLPTSAMIKLFGFSFAGEIPMLQVWTNAAMLLVGVMVVLGLVGWRLRWQVRYT